MRDKNRWSEPDWEWLPDVGYDDVPFGSRTAITGFLLVIGLVAGLIAGIWYLV